MAIARIALGALAYMVAVFPLAYVWHLVLFRYRLEAAGYLGRAEPIVPLGFLAILIQGVLVAWCYASFRSGGPFRDALLICLPLMAMIWTAQVLAHAAKFEVQVGPFLAVESLYFIIQAALVCLALGLVGTLLDWFLRSS